MINFWVKVLTSLFFKNQILLFKFFSKFKFSFSMSFSSNIFPTSVCTVFSPHYLKILFKKMKMWVWGGFRCHPFNKIKILSF
jgi:hypothetical protein